MKTLIFLSIFLLSNCSDWAYSGKNSPQNWGALGKKYRFCKTGLNQSPIDINLALVKDFAPIDLKFDYKISEVEKINQKFNQKINFYGKSFVWRGKKKYWLRAIEFHHPSEHLIESEPHSLEMQIYHKSEDEQWLVLSYFIELDIKNLNHENRDFTKLIAFLKSKNSDDKFDLAMIIPQNNLGFFYDGSFTTPPCTEGVKWYIMKTPLYVAKEQLNNIIKSTIFVKTNARNVQKYNPEKF